MGRVVVGWVVALTFLVSTLWAPSGAEAAGIVVRMTAPDGYLIARRNERRIELKVPGQTVQVFENATISVGRGRIYVSARTRDRTVVAWANRSNETGGVGMLLRTSNPRKPESYGFYPKTIAVDGEAPIIRVNSSRR
jgi:hypothetical protein